MRILVGEGGFEPPKSLTADLQSVPFGHSGIPPYSLCCTHFETQRSGFKMKRRKAIADMELFASAESGMEQASFDGGAGRRIRTPDLLITKIRLYVYCVHFVPVLPDTSNFSTSFRVINLCSIKAFFPVGVRVGVKKVAFIENVRVLWTLLFAKVWKYRRSMRPNSIRRRIVGTNRLCVL